MNGDIAALAYLEWRTRVNEWRETLRTPAKLVMLFLGIAYYAIFSVLRVVNQHNYAASAGLREPFATLTFCGMLFLLSIMMLSGARGVLKMFSSFADARFLICSSLREEIVIPFLVFRNNLFTIGRLAMLALLYAIIFPMAGGLVGMFFGLLGIFFIGSVLGPLAFRIRTVFGAVVAQGLVAVFALAALVPAAAIGAGALWAGARPLAHWALGLGLGRTIVTIFAGNPAALSMLYALFFLLAFLSFIGARDLYPEIYASSYLGMITVARRADGAALPFRATSKLPKSAVSSASSRGMTGAWAIFWKDWVVFRRANGVQWTFAIGMALGLVVGFISGELMQSPTTSAVGITLLVTALTCMFVMVSLMATVVLDMDLGKPMWWLSASPLRTRLYVWTIATAWRTVLPLAVGVMAFGVASGNLVVALCALPGAAVAVVFLRSIGVALYTIFPWNGGADPMARMLRMPLSMLALLPPALAFVVASAAAQQLGFGVLCAAIVTIGETLLFLEFAVARITGNGAAIAREAA